MLPWLNHGSITRHALSLLRCSNGGIQHAVTSHSQGLLGKQTESTRGEELASPNCWKSIFSAMRLLYLPYPSIRRASIVSIRLFFQLYGERSLGDALHKV